MLLTKNIKIKFYDINLKLHIEENSLNISSINDRSIILIVNYFGFPSNWEFINKIKRETHCITVEDNCHTLKSSYHDMELGNYGDISFNSLRKVLPVLSGSTITSERYNISSTNKSLFPNFSQIKYSLRSLKVKHSLSKLKKISNKVNLDKNMYELKYPGIDVFSKKIHSNYRFDYKDIKIKRTNNFKFWDQFIDDKGLERIINLRDLDNVTPYVFPCIPRNEADSTKWIQWGLDNNIVIIKWPNLSKDIIKIKYSLKNVLLFPVNDQYNLTCNNILHEF